MKPVHLRNVPPPAETFNHFEFLKYMASWIKPERYLELGVSQGKSLISIAPYCKEIIAVDINQPELPIPQNCNFIKTTTDNFFSSIADDAMFDMVFIDADHSHEQSFRDFLNVKDRVIEDGFIFLHDTYPYSLEFTSPGLCNDAYKTALFIKNQFGKDFEYLTLPFNPGVTILKKMKRSKQLAWKKF